MPTVVRISEMRGRAAFNVESASVGCDNAGDELILGDLES
jgi:hypothetical protein